MISIKNLTKSYKGFQLNVSLEIPSGRVTGLIGKNGAGKSTTIKAILGLIRPDNGDLTVLGKNPFEFTPADREQIGTALSDSGFSLALTVTDIIHILKKMYRDFDENSFRRLCTEQALPFDKKIKDFSTGMKAKLRVLVAISHKAKLLVLDEPTSGLDVIARNEILDLLRDYLAEDEERSILISSHISTDLEGLCDDLYIIQNGSILLHEDTDTLLGKYGILKLDEAAYQNLDKHCIPCARKDPYGYTCRTNENQFYLDNYPGIVIENGNIDNILLLLLGSKAA